MCHAQNFFIAPQSDILHNPKSCAIIFYGSTMQGAMDISTEYYPHFTHCEVVKDDFHISHQSRPGQTLTTVLRLPACYTVQGALAAFYESTGGEAGA